MDDELLRKMIRLLQEQRVLELPPGYRFNPTDQELLIYYLCEKILDNKFSTIAITDVDLNSCEPWTLPSMGRIGEKEWYFFCVRDKKYPSGQRTNRATNAGYWKATGKDKDIYQQNALIGMKKTLVFYKGRAPKGEKTNWVMHEYRMDGDNPMNSLSKLSKEDWAVYRIFEKTSIDKNIIHVPGELRELSPVIDSPAATSTPSLSVRIENALRESLTTFSGPNQTHEDMNTKTNNVGINVDSFETPLLPMFSPPPPPPSELFSSAWDFMNHDQSMMSLLFDEDHASNAIMQNNNNEKNKAKESDFDAGISSDLHNNEMFPTSSGGNQGDSSSGCKWNF